jgi:hypothetical protein
VRASAERENSHATSNNFRKKKRHGRVEAAKQCNGVVLVGGSR